MKKPSLFSQLHTRITGALASLIFILVIGTLGYKIIAEQQTSWIDALYMTFITVATIGFAEIIDMSHNPAGRIFTMIISLAGMGILAYTLSLMTAFIIEGDMNRAWRRRHMLNYISTLKNHYIICGAGRVGSNIARELLVTQRPFVAIEESSEALQHFLEKFPNASYLHGDACDDDLLHAAGVNQAGGVFAVTGEDSKNMVISLSVKQLNPSARIVARIHDVKNEDKTRRAGADAIVSPDFTGSLRLVSAMIRPHAASFLDEMLRSDKNLRVEEITVGEQCHQKTLAELNLHSRNYVLLALRQAQNIFFNPTHTMPLSEGDILIVMTTPTGRKELVQKLA